MPLFRGLIILAICWPLLAVPAYAERPAGTIAGYKHTGWTAENGGPAVVNDLAQSPDGYLWITSPDGLFRFDGATFEKMPGLSDPELGPFQPLVVYAAPTGDIWIGYRQGGIARYRRGELRNMKMPNAPEFIVDIVGDENGGLWILSGRDQNSLTHFSNGSWQEIGEAQGLPLGQVRSLVVSRSGTTWIQLLKRLFFRRRGAVRFEATPEPVGMGVDIAESPAGQLWLVDQFGARKIPDYPNRSGTKAPPVRYAQGGLNPTLLFDRAGNLWSTDRASGLSRIGASSLGRAGARAQTFTARDGLSSDRARPLLQDREGNIWVGTESGLDRFRPAALRFQEGIPNGLPTGYGAERDADGILYVALDEGIFSISSDQPAKRIAAPSDEITAPCLRRDGSVMVMMEGTFLALRADRAIDGKGIDQSIYECSEDGFGRLWLDSLRNGLLWQDETGLHALAGPPEEALAGGLTIAPSGLAVARLGPRFLLLLNPARPILIPAGKFGVGAIVSVNRGRNDLLISGARGLARWRDGVVRTIDANRYPWVSGLRGLTQSSRGDTWMFSGASIRRVATRDLDRAFDHPDSLLPHDLFDAADGLIGKAQKYGLSGPQILEGRDGSMRFLTSAGVMVLDPDRISRNTAPPSVAVSALIAHGVKYLDPSRVALRAGTSSIQIAYTALSLSVPERVRFRYRLEGVDEEWMDPGTRRQAFYSNLGPGSYRFRVIAANNDGVWNRAGATLLVTIPPTFLQSIWFKLLCALGLGMLLWLAYSMHVRRVTARLQAGLQVRLAERERIARELHDTLLQGFQGLILRFQSVADRIAADQPVRPLIDDALDRADAVLIEGRDRVRELRTASGRGDLAQALMNAANEMEGHSGASFDIVVEGTPRALHRLVREEVQRIGEEAIRNAFQHAGASHIAVSIAFRYRQFQFAVRDDGVGLPSDVAAAGEREGHFGLAGMRERAARIGAMLTIVSRAGAGTEVLLSVPGRAAYASRRRSWRFLRFSAAPAEE